MQGSLFRSFIITKKAKKPKEWEPKIQKEDTDEEDGDYSTESE